MPPELLTGLTSGPAFKLGSPDGLTEKEWAIDNSGELKTESLEIARSVKAIYAQLSDTTDQKPSVTTPVAITLDTQGSLFGVTHSTTVNPEEITIVTSGIYCVFAGAQVQRTTTGGADKIWHMFLQKDTGSGFVDVADSNIEEKLDSLNELVSPLNMFIPLNAGDKIRFMQSTNETGHGVGISAKVPSGEPKVPSIIASICRIVNN